MTKDTDLYDYVTKSNTLYNGPVLYNFFEELRAYVESTAFSPDYLQNDPSTAGDNVSGGRGRCRQL